MAHDPKKLTLADFTFASGGLVAPPGMEFHKLSDGFWTCGVGCPDPHACLANEHCERGFVGNAIGFTSPPPLQVLQDAAGMHDAFDAGWAAKRKPR